MASVKKLFKALKDSPGKGVKRHIAQEIISTYCRVSAISNLLFTETLSLSESTTWEDRVAASRVIEEMARCGSICESFILKEYSLSLDIDEVLARPKFLAAYYNGQEDSKAKGKSFIDLEDHNVVLSLSNIKIPGVAAKDKDKKDEGGLFKRKKAKERKEDLLEKKEIESAEGFYSAVLSNLESYTWETRHGAALVLLGLFRGMHLRESQVLTSNTLDSGRFLRPLLVTLMLDRFNDYEMDVALSPVRETVGKALQELYGFLPGGVAAATLSLLATLGGYEEWQVKYSGLIGVRCILGSAGLQLTPKIAASIGEVCLGLLNDFDEDVKGMAASILEGLVSSRAAEGENKQMPVSGDKIVELCWEALAEEEDLAAAKAKIIALMETLRKLGCSLGELDKEQYLSLLRLVRNSIDSVRLAVLQLLESVPVVSPRDALSALMFSMLMETEEEISRRTRPVLAKVVKSVGEKDLKSVVEAMLPLICASPSSGDALKKLGTLIVIGETDICVSDDGCKAAGPERVLFGRVALFEAIMDMPETRAVAKSFFKSSSRPLPYFGLFKGVLSISMGQAGLEEFLEVEAKLENNGDLNRGVFALVRIGLGKAPTESYSALLYLFMLLTPMPLLRLLSRTIRQMLIQANRPVDTQASSNSHSKCLEDLLNFAVEAVCKREEELQREDANRLAEKEDKKPKEREVKRPKVADDIPEDEEPWRLQVLFQELGDEFLSTPSFQSLKQNPTRAVSFLKSTLSCFTRLEELVFAFKPAIDLLVPEVVGFLIGRDSALNELFVLQMKDILDKMPSNPAGNNYAKQLVFLEACIPSSRPDLLVVLVFPLIRTMNVVFSAPGVREAASKAFSALVPFMYLKSPVVCAHDTLRALVLSERSKIEDLHRRDDLSSVPMKVTLREYQKKGIEWLGFLHKSGLSGMLCDDMGLGKTVQVLAFIALQQTKTKQPGPVLVMCPSALTGHWHTEVDSLFPTLSSTTIQDFKGVGICVASYDKFRMNYEAFTQYNWHYLVLDEGHIIKNANTVLHARVKMLRAQNKILLSGTPIQNSVAELWALFDILMPGYLGSEKEFGAEYLRPIMRGREDKGTLAEAEEARKKLEALHQRVLPFMLRRMKEAVLADLPPKVITDVRVQMEEVQRKIYEELLSEGDTAAEYGEVSTSSRSFAHLSKLIRTCSHPGLLSKTDDPLGLSCAERAKLPSGKMLALLDLLKTMVGTSKVLVFCQYKATIDIVSATVAEVMPEVRWCRLDGTVKGDERAALAKRFNGDPELSIMYLSTHAGGLGLNLTGADVVIFFEHDWNPMMDLQAMDRAHRLGQKRSVSVFRLITERTIEESIMSLQNFKRYIAGAIVNQQNVEIESMDTANALERFGKEKTSAAPVDKEDEYRDLF
ncbi:TATA-binding protein-associated factor [Nematocida homosporus]|uniref:TATA-binding protein-associated factor n=1 Tax=Nematocida homosporus TaxID=1912981 RepID=UPI0022203958|nr:TATA-binding protein-associated factor [Nematocida homosporus]KAI5187183.1 TATA-binding protein-associated factor [Nematocida homosporus]